MTKEQREVERERDRVQRVKHRGKTIIRMREYRAKNKDKVRAWNRKSFLKRAYGLTVADFEALIAKADNKCEICNRAVQTSRYALDSACIDHDHKTGAVRGILCNLCNAALGKFGDSPETLRRAAEYLERV